MLVSVILEYKMLTAEQIVESLQLEKHVEGGYFKRTYASVKKSDPNNLDSHAYMSSIYYLLTDESMLSYFVINKSDLILYYHGGSPLEVIFIHPSGEVETKILGLDVMNGAAPQCFCPAGVCKAYRMVGGDYCLISEAVCPEFKYEDMQMVSAEDVLNSTGVTASQLADYSNLFAGNDNK